MKRFRRVQRRHIRRLARNPAVVARAALLGMAFLVGMVAA